MAVQQTPPRRNHHAWLHTGDLSPPSSSVLLLLPQLVWLLSPNSFANLVPSLSESPLVVFSLLPLLLSSSAQGP